MVPEQGAVIAMFGCRQCGAPGDLRSATCYSHVLRAFVEELQIDGLILASLSHRQYSKEFVELLRRQAAIVRDIDRAAARPGAAAGEKGTKCAKCPMLPRAVFEPTARAFFAASLAATDAAERLPQMVAAMPPPTFHAQCAGCVAQTNDDAAQIAKDARASRQTVTRIAYGVEASP